MMGFLVFETTKLPISKGQLSSYTNISNDPAYLANRDKWTTEPMTLSTFPQFAIHEFVARIFTGLPEAMRYR
jgi:hypothetical protein